MPRAYPTIGEKLLQYSNKSENYNILEYMIAYAATNGEFSTQNDTEYADVKMNRSLDKLVNTYLPHYTTQLQCSEFDDIYKRYIFVTRWKTYDKVVLNRLLPEEDFDSVARVERVYTAEQQALEIAKKKKDRISGKADSTPMKSVEAECQEGEKRSMSALSSIILWSVCPDANSNEWFNLFEVENFNQAYEDRNIFREIMNKND